MKASKGNSVNDRNLVQAALLVIDVQQGLFKKSTPIYHAEELLQNLNLLIDLAHECNAPVFFIQHSDSKTLVKGSPDWQLHARLQPHTKDSIIHKQHGNAFEDTPLVTELQKRNVSCLVITGLVTHGCVRATCLGALQLGYKVILVEDGHSSYSGDAARLIEEWNQKLSEKNVEIKPASEITFGVLNSPGV